MKNFKNLERKLNAEGYELKFGKYHFWDNVPYAVKEDKRTALVWDGFGGTTISRFDSEDTSWDYIKEVLDGEYENLGLLNYNNKGFGIKQKFLAWEV